MQSLSRAHNKLRAVYGLRSTKLRDKARARWSKALKSSIVVGGLAGLLEKDALAKAKSNATLLLADGAVHATRVAGEDPMSSTEYRMLYTGEGDATLHSERNLKKRRALRNHPGNPNPTHPD